AGRSYPDLVRLRTGKLEWAPDAILRPGDAAAVAATLQACAEARVAVVPYGGGTSVVGGLDAVGDDHDAVVSLHLAHLPALARRTARAWTLRPGCRDGAQRPRRDPRSLPPVLRAGHDRWLRRDALRWSGLERLRALRRDGHGDRADRALGAPPHPPDPAHGCRSVPP